MSLTSISRIRKHLARINLTGGTVRGQAVRLTGTDYFSLPHRNIVENTEKVRAVKNDTPEKQQVALGDIPAVLPHGNPVPDSLVCAADSSLGRIYRENSDYSVDYDNGTISRVVGGEISSGAVVTLWYLHYRDYSSGADYLFDFTNGRIRRLISGNIEDGQEVIVDYELGSTGFTDDEIEQAAGAAESEIDHVIDGSHRESTDPALQTAATLLALSYLCRNAAGAAAGISDDSRTSGAWVSLAESYDAAARRLLTFFGRTSPRMKPPKLS